MNKILAVILIFIFKVGFAQSPQVPSTIKFADLELKLDEQVRRDIQADVDALHRSSKYFDIKLARVKMYFPIIERIFEEENLPNDFKYLVIQESALISDAISTSDAVGYWQFKEVSAKEVGLRVDSQVDERMNIVSSSRGAAKYLKKNNFYLNNWLYSLLAYNTGLGGVETFVEDKYRGAKKMNLNKKTHWYIKKFLAHKIAFEEALQNSVPPEKKLYEYTQGGGESLEDISAQFKVDPDEVRNFNKWLRRGRVPEDKVYSVIIPGVSENRKLIAQEKTSRNKNVLDFSPNSKKYPVIKEMNKVESRLVKVNGIPGIVAVKGEELAALAAIGGVGLSNFLAYNEIDISYQIKPGDVFYFKKKKNKAKEYYHTLNRDETLWEISQKFGIKKSKLMNKNRLENENSLKPGLILWLRNIRPEDYPAEYVNIPIPEKDLTKLPSGKNESVTPVAKEEPEETMITTENLPVDLEKTESVPVEKSEVNEEIMLPNHNKEMPEELLAEMSEQELKTMAADKLPLFHLVESGETLYGISRKYNVKIQDLLTINDLSIDDGIKIGQKIYLKDPFPEENIKNLQESEIHYIVYKVKKGDTMYKISKKYDVTIEEIMEWNNKTSHHLNYDEDLKIKVTE